MKDFENKKILYVFEYFPPTIQGGAEISGELRARHLTKNNSVFILTPNYEKLKLEVKKQKFKNKLTAGAGGVAGLAAVLLVK